MTGLTSDERALLYRAWVDDVANNDTWGQGRADIKATEDAVARIVAERTRGAREQAVLDFTHWVAINRAYNGSDHPHGQSLYNECLNSALPTWAMEYLRAALGGADESDVADHMAAYLRGHGVSCIVVDSAICRQHPRPNLRNVGELCTCEER